MALPWPPTAPDRVEPVPPVGIGERDTLRRQTGTLRPFPQAPLENRAQASVASMVKNRVVGIFDFVTW